MTDANKPVLQSLLVDAHVLVAGWEASAMVSRETGRLPVMVSPEEFVCQGQGLLFRASHLTNTLWH